MAPRIQLRSGSCEPQRRFVQAVLAAITVVVGAFVLILFLIAAPRSTRFESATPHDHGLLLLHEGANATVDDQTADRPVAGELVTETLEYDGGRQVTVYVPSGSPEAVVFAGDGQLVAQWGGALELADAPHTLVVGAHRRPDETVRRHEYSPGFDPQRFEAHERFFVDDIRRWIKARFAVALPATRTAVYGASAGGELALAMGLRHPDVYSAVLCASPGAGFRPPEPMPNPLPRVYLVAGTQEPFFLENATKWEAALKAAGADVVLHERPGEHGGAFWQEEFPQMVMWAFPH